MEKEAICFQKSSAVEKIPQVICNKERVQTAMPIYNQGKQQKQPSYNDTEAEIVDML